MVIYNTSAIDVATNPYLTAVAVNNLSNGLLFNLILLACYLVILISMKLGGEETKTTFLVASAMTSLIATFMMFLNLIIGAIAILPIISLFISIFIYKFGGD